MCVNAHTWVCKVPSNIYRVKEASVANPTQVNGLGYLVYTSVASAACNAHKKTNAGTKEAPMGRVSGEER